MDGDAVRTGVPHAAVLLAFAEAMLGDDMAAQGAARAALHADLGDAALVDAAALVASFNAVVKIADATGIPLEDAKARATEGLRAGLGLDAMRSDQ